MELVWACRKDAKQQMDQKYPALAIQAGGCQWEAQDRSSWERSREDYVQQWTRIFLHYGNLPTYPLHIPSSSLAHCKPYATIWPRSWLDCKSCLDHRYLYTIQHTSWNLLYRRIAPIIINYEELSIIIISQLTTLKRLTDWSSSIPTVLTIVTGRVRSKLLIWATISLIIKIY